MKKLTFPRFRSMTSSVLLSSLRIGAVSYLNSKPLVEELDRFLPRSTLEFDTPSSLAHRMKSGEFDIGLIPLVEFLNWEDCRYLPGMAVGCNGPVRSVCVHSKVDWKQVNSTAMDEGSRTSVALTRVIFRERGWNTGPTHSLPMNDAPSKSNADAVLLIGDRAMDPSLRGYPWKIDLGQEWLELTGLPFVFALWAVRPGLKVSTASLGAFQKSLELGRQRVAEIARRESRLLKKNEADCLDYLTNNIRYDLGPEQLKGITEFQKKLDALGLVKWRTIHEVDRDDSPIGD